MRFKEYLVKRHLMEYDKPSVVPSEVRELSDTGKWKVLGNGFYAVVYDNVKDSSSVIKRSRSGIVIDADGESNDAYFNYILGIQNDPKLIDNPFFPQIYRIEFFVKNRNIGVLEVNYEIEMEKLRDLSFLRKHSNTEGFIDALDDPHSLESQLYNALSRIIDEDNLKSFIKHNDRDWFYYLMFDIFHFNIKIRDSNFREAIDYIWNVDGGFDMHDGNIMYRPTPYGMQLVITDPLS